MSFDVFFSAFSPFIDGFVSMLNSVVGIFFRIKIFNVPIIIYPLFFGFLIFVFSSIMGVDTDD